MVIKRDGSKEKFSTKKIEKVLRAAGASENQSTKVASGVSDWLDGLKPSSMTSIQIRDKVIELLKKTNSYAADLYQWYEKTKDNPSEM